MRVFDLETDGFVEKVTKVHCLNGIDRITGQRIRFTDNPHYFDGSPTPRAGTIADGLDWLHDCFEIGGQNIIKYDLRVLKKLFGWTPHSCQKIRDTRVEASVIWTNLTDVDFRMLRNGKLPPEFQKKGLIGSQSLKAWGYRLGLHKGDFDPKDFGYTWETVPFLREMDDYCAQDNEVTVAWFDRIDEKNYSRQCLELEGRVALVIAQQEDNGFAFDEKAAEKLYAELLKQKLA